MPVPGKSVGPHRLIALRIEVVDGGLPTRPADTAGAGDDNARVIERPGPDQGNQRQLDARRIAPGTGNERRGPDRLTGEFRDRVDRFPEQLRGGMLPAIVVGIDLRLPEPEVGAQVEDHLAGLQRRRGILSGDTVGQGQKDRTRIARGNLGGIRLGEDQPRNLEAGKPRHHLPEGFAGMLAREDRRHLGHGMPVEQGAEFLAGVAAGSDNRHLQESGIGLGG